MIGENRAGLDEQKINEEKNEDLKNEDQKADPQSMIASVIAATHDTDEAKAKAPPRARVSREEIIQSRT